MTTHVTIELDEEVLARARLVAEALGIATEEYLRGVIAGTIPVEVAPSRQQFYLAKIFGMGSSAEPTDRLPPGIHLFSRKRKHPKGDAWIPQQGLST